MNHPGRRIVEPTATRCMRGVGCSLVAALLATSLGCFGSGRSQPERDSALQRHVKYASEAYSEGQIDRAIVEYRKAVRRAWSMDDPYESGTTAYNLAACLTSNAQSREARDWLLDARVELHRAGASAGNAWLLDAKIALSESRFEDVQYLVQRAACSDPPCPDQGTESCCGKGDPCRDRCVARIPCVGPRIKKHRAAKDCQETYQAQIHLVRARLAAEQYDIPLAQRELECACRLAEVVCSDDLRAELHNVAALIHIAKGEYLQAGRHFDREAENLRLAGNYREIPTSLELASASYEQAGLVDLAADRLCRVARTRFGQGEVDQAWRDVQRALPMAEAVCSETIKVRLSLTANEMLHVLSQQDDPAPAKQVNTQQQDEVGMLGPANAFEDQ